MVSNPSHRETPKKWLRPAVFALLNILLIAVNGCGARRTNSNSSNVTAPSTANAVKNDKTRELYTKNCVLCHQANGEGGTVKLEDEKLKVPSLKSDRARKHSDENMIDQILKGGDGMPAFKEKLNRDDINDLVRFIREDIQGNAPKRQD
jgi:mono/diheme cytochrome c family protein